jgi:hypothetical protein
MQWVEARWIREQLARLSDEQLFPLVDIGSSTRTFRTAVQPYIDAEVFAPLRARGGPIWHVDRKADEGVDFSGDVLEASFRERLRGLAPRTITAFNLIMHVLDPHAFARALVELVPPGGWLVVTGPVRLPRTPDPIDNGFRATPEEAAALFPGLEVVASATLDAGNWRQWRVAERGRSLTRTLLRLCTPFYRPIEWWNVAHQVPYLLRHLRTFGLVLRKP